MNLNCFITGANGYLGSAIRKHLVKQGMSVTSLVRKSEESLGKTIYFSLSEDFASDHFSNCDVLIHCAYDFKAISWNEIKKQNVDPSIKFLSEAKAKGVKKIIFISSISAFENCHSLYGKAKLEIEKFTNSISGISIRPGLVYGDASGGMVGSLRNSIKNSSIVPVVGAKEKMFLCHEEDLANLIFKIITNDLNLTKAITAASNVPWEFIEILKKLARQLNKDPFFIPLPWQLVWLAIKSAETIGLKLNFRSDSLISLVNPNPHPDFSMVEELGIKFRTFA